MSEKRQVLKAAGIVGAFTLLSRFTGLLRVSILSAIFGAGRVADTFQLAFEVANITRRVLGEGALSAFIVPLLTQRRKEHGIDAGWHFFNLVTNLMLLIAALLTVLGVIFSQEVYLLFGGIGQMLGGTGEVTPNETLALGSQLTRIMFPFVIGLTLASLMMGACHTLNRFVSPSFGSVMLNLSMIGVGWLALKTAPGMERAALWLSWAVLAGAVLRVAIMVPTLMRGGWRWRPVLTLRDREIWTLLRMMGLAILGMGVAQINIIVSNFFATYLDPGVKSYLFYSQMLIQFPMALTASAAATAMLPQLTRFLLESRWLELHNLMAFTKRLELVLIIPAMMGLIILGLPIAQLILQQGQFTADDSMGAYLAMLGYAPGLLALSWVRLITPLFYARKDMMTPLKAAAIGMVVNIILNAFFAFMTPLRQAGLALANSIAAYVTYAVIAYYFRRDFTRPPDAEPTHYQETFWKAIAASAAACAAGLAIYLGLTQWLGAPATKLFQLAYLLPVIALVAVLYFVLARLIHVPDSARATQMLLGKLRRR